MNNFIVSKIERCKVLLNEISDYCIEEEELKEDNIFYVLENDYSNNFDAGHRILGVYTSYKKAAAAFEVQLEEEKAFANEYGCNSEEFNKLYYEAWKEGFWSECHTWLKVTCVKM